MLYDISYSSTPKNVSRFARAMRNMLAQGPTPHPYEIRNSLGTVPTPNSNPVTPFQANMVVMFCPHACTRFVPSGRGVYPRGTISPLTPNLFCQNNPPLFVGLKVTASGRGVYTSGTISPLTPNANPVAPFQTRKMFMFRVMYLFVLLFVHVQNQTERAIHRWLAENHTSDASDVAKYKCTARSPGAKLRLRTSGA